MKKFIVNREENFKKGLLTCEFLRSHTPKEPFLIDGFPVTDWKSFVNSHCGVLENRGQFERNYNIWRTWYMRAYQAKKHIEENEQES